MNSNQFIALIGKGNGLQKEDYQQLVKLHDSFPFFQIPAALAAKYEFNQKEEFPSVMLHKAAILSPDRTRLKYIIENDNVVLSSVKKTTQENSPETPSTTILVTEIGPTAKEGHPHDETKEIISGTVPVETSEKADTEPRTNLGNGSDAAVTLPGSHHEKADSNTEKAIKKTALDREEPILENNHSNDEIKQDDTSLVTSSTSEDINSRPELVTSSNEVEEENKPVLILPDAVKTDSNRNKEDDKEGISTNEEKNIDISSSSPISGPIANRQHILKQLEENLAKLKSDPRPSSDLESEPKDANENKSTKHRRRKTGDDLIDSIKKKEKQEIKDTKKKEQNDIIKAFNKKSIKLAAIKENEDVNKLQDLSLPSTKINDRLVSESYAKLLTQQGKKAAALEIYKKLILKFPEKKAYFADLIQQLEE
ncbi:hypothetical protein [Anditalea andensis]|uniref:Tetratricopeptide repeat protein n=1 Tax=Anditalea andensis TaxID=1048983 RepID=A0A074LL31_9BACT|nr:hypothetical protein [Anditalea andensis]KEO74547.1 hypothetical protein EL17_02410 [Anditalea andensis]